MRFFRLRHLQASGLLVLLPFLGACPERKSVWVTSSENGLPVFLFGARAGKPKEVLVDILRVDRCNTVDQATGETKIGQTMWAIVPESRSSGRLQRVEYGVTPHGYSEISEMRPLTPGCYVVIASANAVARFELDSMRVITPLTGDELEKP